MKYCTNCGKSVDNDQAVFCSACGAKFPSAQLQGQKLQPLQTSGITYMVEMVPGAHKHIYSDISLKDAQGKEILLAKKTSTFSLNYSLFDENQVEQGYIKSERGLSSMSFIAEDANHTPISKSIVQHVGGFGYHLPKIWIEDTSGQKQIDIQLVGSGTFSGVRTADGFKVLEGSWNRGEGFKQTWTAFTHQNYSIRVYDPSFTTLQLFSFIAALESDYQ